MCMQRTVIFNEGRSTISRQFIYIKNKAYSLLKLEKILLLILQMGELMWRGVWVVSDLPSKVAGWIINIF